MQSRHLTLNRLVSSPGSFRCFSRPIYTADSGAPGLPRRVVEHQSCRRCLWQIMPGARGESPTATAVLTLAVSLNCFLIMVPTPPAGLGLAGA